MKLTALISVILITSIGLASELPSLSKTSSNSQLKQAFGAQKWGRTIKVVNQMKKGTDPKYNSNLTLYQAVGLPKQQ